MFQVRDQVGNQLPCPPAASPVPDRHHWNLVLPNELLHLPPGFDRILLLAVRINDRIFQEFTRLIQDSEFAPRADAGVHGQHFPTPKGRLEQQAAEVLGEHTNSVILGTLGEFPANLPLKSRENQPVEAVRHHTDHQIAMRVVTQVEMIGGYFVRQRHLGFDSELARRWPSRRG